MPDYGEAAEAKGWEKVGSKWVHPDHDTEYNAVSIWKKYPEVRTRPDSITTPEVKPEPEKKAKKE
jgi:hypothetical protein